MGSVSGFKLHCLFSPAEKGILEIMATSFKGFQSLIEHGPDVISLIDHTGQILYGSPSTKEMFGYRPEELVGQNCLDLIHPEDRAPARLALRALLAKPSGRLRWDARIRRDDGTYCWVESTVSNLLLESEVQAIVVHQRSIHEWRGEAIRQQRLAEELARNYARLEEFTYTAAHDLREPLRAILAYAELVAQETQMVPKARQMAKFIVGGATRMSVLVDNLLSFATTGLHEPARSVDLRNAMNQAIENLDLEIRDSGAVVSSDMLPVVPGIEIDLVRLFQNLIGNAIKYRGTEMPKIHISSEQVGLNWLIRVADNGLGVASKDQVRIFTPFVRLGNRDVSGSGLGLAVARKIVEGMGGLIWVVSQLGGGATFCFTIVTTPKETPPLPL